MSPASHCKQRACLVCSTTITGLHGGFDVCRACATFFKRISRRRAALNCRQGNSNCSVRKGEHFICKKCRLDKCLAIGMQIKEEVDNHDDCRSPPDDLCPENAETPVTSSQVLSRSLVAPAIPFLLNTVATRYRLMFTFRRAGELSLLLPSFPATFAMDSSDIPYQPASFQGMEMVHKIMAAALLDFANSSFDDFKLLTGDERWNMMSRCHMALIMADGCFRTQRLQPGRTDYERCYAGVNCYFSREGLPGFFADAPAPDRHKDAVSIMCRRFETMRGTIFPHYLSLQLSEREYHALIVLIFCSFDMDSSDAVAAFSSKHRSRVLFELQRYFRDEGIFSDEQSAVRICRLLQLVCAFKEAAYEIVRDFEIYRLLDIMNDETIVVQVCGATRSSNALEGASRPLAISS